MKHILLLLLSTAVTAGSYAQTKRVAYMSHSGRDLSYSVFEPDNLGLPPKGYDEIPRIPDSIIRPDSIRTKKDSLKKDSLPKKPLKPGNKKTGTDNTAPQGGIIEDNNDNTPTASLVAASPAPQSGFSGWWLFTIPACVGFIILITRKGQVIPAE